MLIKMYYWDNIFTWSNLKLNSLTTRLSWNSTLRVPKPIIKHYNTQLKM